MLFRLWLWRERLYLSKAHAVAVLLPDVPVSDDDVVDAEFFEVEELVSDGWTVRQRWMARWVLAGLFFLLLVVSICHALIIFWVIGGM